MGSTLPQDQELLQELETFLPSSLHDKLDNVQSYLEVFTNEFSQIKSNEQKAKLLEVVLRIGTDICCSHEIVVNCLLILANFGNEKHAHKFISYDNVTRRLLKALESDDKKINKGEILDALKRIVTDDDNSNVIANSSMLDWLLSNTHEGGSDEIQQKCREVVAALTMSETSKEILASNQKFQKIFPKHQFSLGDILATKRYAQIWRRNSAAKTEQNRSIDGDEEHERKRHVMISYSWKNEDVAIALKNLLESNNIKTWIDRSGVTLDMMEEIAVAVENCSHFLSLVSSHYKQSVYCKMEAKYAVELEKTIIPVHVEEGFVPSGWIAMVTSGLRYHEFYHADDVTSENCSALVELLTS